MKKDKPIVKTFIARKFKRVPLKIKFKVNGRDQNGNQFEDFVETHDVGANGGSFPSKYEVKVGSTLKFTGPKGFVNFSVDPTFTSYLLGKLPPLAPTS